MRFFSKFKASDEYRRFTTKFDVEVHANDIATVLGPLGVEDEAALEQGWQALQTGLLAWKTRLHLLAAESAARIRQKISSEERADTAITLLFDQSGSMRGQRMLFAAATADVAQEFLVTLGFRCEILGFTTSQWKGGRSRQLWMRSFKPRNPGRLNDLLHIIYKSADDRRAGAGTWALRQMLRPDLTKENIDGEAVLWAFGRLSALPPE
jgi:cobaltochelatase CobT